MTRSKLVFWDFDGVIKESVAAKAAAFFQLFLPFGHDFAERVRSHHEENGGMSRFEKIPKYLEWAGVVKTTLIVDDYCRQYSKFVFQRVVEAPWVLGVERILRENPYRQDFVLVTATPQEEIEGILWAIDLQYCFSDILGAPTRKGDAIRKSISRRGINPASCLMIGDSRADFDASIENGVSFLLRRHESNKTVFSNYRGESVGDFIGV